jgi:hypothetical protein
LLAGVEPDLSQATAMAIDGDVWVAIRSGEIYRFRLGNKEQFSVKNMVGEWGEVAGLGLSEDKGLIAWDKGNSRIVNINKETGEYIKQWKWQTLGEADSFVWDEGRNRVIIGKGSDLWSFKLD